MRTQLHLQHVFRRSLGLAITTLTAAPWICLAASQANTDIFGQWRVVSVLDAADITGVSAQRANAFVGKPLDITAAGFQFQDTTCKTPSYARSEQPTAEYLRMSWHARSGNLGLPDSVIVIDARCTDIFIKSSGRLIFNWKGYFLEAVKTAQITEP